MVVKEGDSAPGFVQSSSHMDVPILATLVSRENVVLYFYPKDDTPGCTKEAESFRDAYQEFVNLDTAILGISKDSSSSHENFRKKYQLPFELVSDEGSLLSQMYGVWVEKSMFGKSYMGIERSTFLIDQNRIIRKVWRNVKVHGHVDDVLKALRSL